MGGADCLESVGYGVLCAGGSIRRLATILAPDGNSQYPSSGLEPISIKGLVSAGGGVSRVYQIWYRAAVEFCTPDTFNLSNGLEVSWAP